MFKGSFIFCLALFLVLGKSVISTNSDNGSPVAGEAFNFDYLPDDGHANSEYFDVIFRMLKEILQDNYEAYVKNSPLI